MKTSFEISGHFVDVVQKKIVEGTLYVVDGFISRITEGKTETHQVILPGLVDAHIHIESSMLIPSEFARLAVVHGTVGTVSDPHEIANVLGIPGILFMIGNGKKVPFKFNFGASSCVPATIFETAGAFLDSQEVEDLLALDEIKFLSEMMNFPGVLMGDKVVMEKLEHAKKAGKPIDGHAPGLMGDDAKRYIRAGISTDHECFTREEALDKLKYGMKILIREGSAAKNYDALSDLIDEFPEMIMLCSDDKHPHDLVVGHINELVKRSMTKGYDIMNILRACTYNPVKHYNLDIGLLQPGDPADFIVVDDLKKFNVLQTYVSGVKVAEKGISLIDSVTEIPHNNFSTEHLLVQQLLVAPCGKKIKVQQAIDGQLITHELVVDPLIENGNIISDPGRDVLKLVVKNRYKNVPPSIGFVSGFGLKRGAIASCVAHDSHNIVAVGTDDCSIVQAINEIITHRGGISLTDGREVVAIPLPFAGIMSDVDGYQIAIQYETMDQQVKKMGSSLNAPYMTLSFMALLVIPELKLSDKGLFDGKKFELTSIFY